MSTSSAAERVSRLLAPHRSRVAELWRYYSAGIVNTLFGFGLFALFVRVGLNQYYAQILSTIIGTIFNYFMFRVHVFRGSQHRLWRYAASYFFNYLLGLAGLYLVTRFISPFYPAALLSLIGRLGGGSPHQVASYGSGLISLVMISVVNYFVLKRFVFVEAK